jgi:hypothetical protein
LPVIILSRYYTRYGDLPFQCFIVGKFVECPSPGQGHVCIPCYRCHVCDAMSHKIHRSHLERIKDRHYFMCDALFSISFFLILPIKSPTTTTLIRFGKGDKGGAPPPPFSPKKKGSGIATEKRMRSFGNHALLRPPPCKVATL